MSRSIRLNCGLFATAAAAMSALAANPAPERSFATDPRLNAEVTIEAPMVTLGAAVKQIGAQCGVALGTDDQVRDETVTLIARGRPARQVLRELATVLGYGWSESKAAKGGEPGYRLTEGAAARNRARALRLEYFQAAVAEIDRQAERIRHYGEKYRKLDILEAGEDVQRLRAHAGSLPTSRERLEAENEHFAAEQGYSPESRVLVTAYLGLAPAARERLLLGERLVMAAQRPGAIRMPPHILQGLREARQFERLRTSRPNEVSVARQTPDEFIVFRGHLNRRLFTLQIRARRLGDQRAPGVALPWRVLTPSYNDFLMRPREEAGGDVTADRPQDLQRPVRFLWARKREKDDPLTYGRGVLIAEVARALSKTEPALQFVGDAYFRGLRSLPRGPEVSSTTPGGFVPAESALARLSSDRARLGQLPLGELLKEVAARELTDFHVTRDGWIRARNRFYFLDRPGQIDPEVVRAVFQPVAEGRPYTPEIAMDAARRLSQAQFAALADEQLEFLSDRIPFQGMHSWPAWKLIGVLSPKPQQELLAGNPVRYKELTKPDQAVFRTFIGDVSERPDGMGLDLYLGPRELSALTLTLSKPAQSPHRLLKLEMKDASTPLSTMPLYAKWPVPAGP